MQQSRLIEPMVTTKYSKNHKLREPKKKWLEYYEPKEKTFQSIMERIDELERDTYIVALSGGKDSSIVLDRCMKLNKVDSGLFIKTNTGVQPTEDFIKDRCQSLGVRLHIREPVPFVFNYVAIVMEIGFPDPPMHNMIMAYLKYKAMWKFITDPIWKGKKPVLLSGVRSDESQRRKFNYDHPINVDSKKLWFACPIFYETDEEVYRYYIENNIKRSPSYDVYPSSMECECGCFAGHGEKEAIKKLDPNRSRFFEMLEQMVKEFGTPLAKRHATWGAMGNYESWTLEERQQVLTKFLVNDIEHMEKVVNQTCGECGAGTMKGLEGD